MLEKDDRGLKVGTSAVREEKLQLVPLEAL